MELKDKVIIWDFDGVIVDSDAVRTDSFVHALSAFNRSDVKQLIAYHKENGGLSRFNKLHYFFTEILKEPVTDFIVSHYASRIADYVKDQITVKHIDPYVLDIIQRHKQDMHIVSASMDMELKYICRNLAIDKYFVTINGSQNSGTSKDTTVKTLLSVFNYQKDNVVLVGDSKQDMHAAENNDIHFLGYNFPAELTIDNLLKAWAN